MLKRIVGPAALGLLVMFVWTFVVNGIFGFTLRVEMNRIPNEPEVYRVLKENVVAPGAYMANPALTPEGQFPGGEPVFSVRTSGLGHEAAGRMVFVGPAIMFVALLLAAGLLSMASPRILSRYSLRVLFLVVLGLLLAVFANLTKIGIGGYPVHTALLLAARDVGSWTLAGLVMAWTLRAPGDAPRTA
jgi:ABC-type Na+ efflux pump permease subunit